MKTLILLLAFCGFAGAQSTVEDIGVVPASRVQLGYNNPQIVTAVSTAGSFTRSLSSVVADGAVNIKNFGAGSAVAGDDTTALQAAVAYANSNGKVLYIPKGDYYTAQTINPQFGIIGDGSNVSRLNVAPAGATSLAGHALVSISTTSVPVQGFALRGLAGRPNPLTANPAAIGFAGYGLSFEGAGGANHAIDVNISGFLRGINCANYNGHIGGTSLKVNNNFYNLFIQTNSGDYRFFDSNFVAPFFASIGAQSQAGMDNSGITNLFLFGVHLGFGPYGIYLEDGRGAAGLVNPIFVGTSFEQIGNKAIRLGINQPDGTGYVTSSGWQITYVGHSWAPLNSGYVIQGDPNNPIQDYAVGTIDYAHGDTFEMHGAGWQLGTSGYAVHINTETATIFDDPRLYQVDNPTLADIRDPRGMWSYTFAIPTGVADDSSILPLGVFDVSSSWFRYGANAEATFNLTFGNTNGMTENGYLEVQYGGAGAWQTLANVAIPPGGGPQHFTLPCNLPMKTPRTIAFRLQSVTSNVSVQAGITPTVTIKAWP